MQFLYRAHEYSQCVYPSADRFPTNFEKRISNQSLSILIFDLRFPRKTDIDFSIFVFRFPQKMNFNFQFSFSNREWSKTEVRTSYGHIVSGLFACCYAHVLLAFVSFRVSKRARGGHLLFWKNGCFQRWQRRYVLFFLVERETIE